MKKRYLWMIAMMATMNAAAQINLDGSQYRQSFDSLGKGLPEGWTVITDISTAHPEGAHSSFIATAAATTSWANATGSFKNMASAKGFGCFAAGTTAKQTGAPDRALGLKQTSKFGDPGAGFVFQAAQTYGLSNFELQFQLQSLDSSGGGRSTEWQVEYALGYAPDSFIQVPATGSLITGDHQFRNELITVSFDKLLDNSPVPVWIRIVTRKASTGSGSRTATAIDNFELNWSGTALTEPRPLLLSNTPANGAIDVDTGSDIILSFSRSLSRGSGNFYITDETDTTTEVLSATDTSVIFDDREIRLPHGLLLQGKTYHITYDSTIADTAGYLCFGSYDSTAFHFSTIAPPPVTTGIVDPARYRPDCFIAGQPGNNSITLITKTIEHGPATVAFYNANGVRLFDAALILDTGTQTHTLALPELPQGVYFLLLKQQTGVCMQQCILGN